jgi:hypothetical protein
VDDAGDPHAARIARAIVELEITDGRAPGDPLNVVRGCFT